MAVPTYTFADVKRAFEERGYTLLSKEYKGVKSNLEFICPNGHQHATTWERFKKGAQCLYCSKSAPKTIEDIRQGFAEKGFKLLSESYVNAHKKLSVECPNGHEISINWANFTSGNGCKICSRKASPTREELESAFSDRGYKLLDTEYINSNTKLSYICKQGHQHSITWDHFKKRQETCPHCTIGRAFTHSLDAVKSMFQEKGYTLLTKSYKNNRQNLECICPNGHVTTLSLCSLQEGKNCAECSGVKKKTFQEVKAKFDEMGYTLLDTEYRNSKQRLNYICSRGHRAKSDWISISKGIGCRQCFYLLNRGEAHPRWNPNLSDEERGKRRSRPADQKEWRKNVFEKDDYTCQKCFIGGQYIVAHHLNAYRDYPDQRTDVDNGVTLCLNCHTDFHSHFGFGGNTKEQFLDFLMLDPDSDRTPPPPIPS